MTYEINVRQIVDDVIKNAVQDYEKISKDRLDFGFDSIYFRYAEVVEELSWMKLKEERSNGNMRFDRKCWADGKKMHFYNCLEQLLQAHSQEEDK